MFPFDPKTLKVLIAKMTELCIETSEALDRQAFCSESGTGVILSDMMMQAGF